MALSEENGNSGMVMPVQPMGGNYGGNYGGYGYPMMGYPVMPMMGGGFGNGFGNMFGGDGAWILLLLLLCGGGWGGLGGMLGGFGFGGWGMDGAFPWLLASNANNQNATNAGFDNLGLANSLSGIHNAVTSGTGDIQLGIAGVNQNICQTGNSITNALNSGFSDVQMGIAGVNQGVSNAAAGIQNSLCNGFAGVNAAISNTAAQGEIAANGRHSALTSQLYNGEINALNRSFAEQTANTAGFNAMQGQLAQCCCDNKLATVQTQGVVQTEAAATRAANAANTQAILDKLCALELDGVKSDLAAAQRENVALQNQLNMAAARADNVAQTAALTADNAAQTQYIVNRVAPYPVPAYAVSNPYGCNNGWNGYGWNNGGNFGGPNPFGNVGFGNGSF